MVLVLAQGTCKRTVDGCSSFLIHKYLRVELFAGKIQLNSCNYWMDKEILHTKNTHTHPHIHTYEHMHIHIILT